MYMTKEFKLIFPLIIMQEIQSEMLERSVLGSVIYI